MILVRKLEADDDLSAFRSGNKDLDRWVKKYGLANQHLYGVTYLAVDGDAIAGFVTIVSSSVVREQIGGSGGPTSWPVLLLARMATASDRQGQGIGKLLMRHVFEQAVMQHGATGCSAVVVDAKPEAVGFYKKFLFASMRVIGSATPSQTAMYLEIGTVLAAMRE